MIASVVDQRPFLKYIKLFFSSININKIISVSIALNQTSCDSGVMLFSSSKGAFAPKENGDKFETKIKNGPDLLADRKLLKRKSELNSESKSGSKNESKNGSEENKTFKSVALVTKKPKIKDYYKDTLAQRELLKLEENMSLETNKIEATPVARKLSEMMDETIINENSSQISSKRKLLKSDSLEAKKPKSQRRDKSEEILNNKIETTEKLSEIMDKAIIIENSSQKVSNLPEIDSDQESCDLDLGVKLFSASKGAFVPKTIVETKIQVRPDLLAHRKLLINCDSGSDSEENEAFKSVAVSPEWVLEQRGYYKGPDESKLITEM